MNAEDMTGLFSRVRECVGRTFKADPDSIQRDSGPGTVPGWDSIGHLRLMMQVELDFKVRFTSKQISQPNSVRELCALLDSIGVHE